MDHAAPDPTYQVRYGLTRDNLITIPGSLAFTCGGMVMISNGLSWLGGLMTAFFGTVFLTLIAFAASRRVALRADAEALTLALPPPWSTRRTAVIPWSDIRNIVLWRQFVGMSTIRYIGVERQNVDTDLPGSARSDLLRRLNASAAPTNVPEQVVQDSRPINGWRLDRERLEQAVNRFAPHVGVVDIR